MPIDLLADKKRKPRDLLATAMQIEQPLDKPTDLIRKNKFKQISQSFAPEITKYLKFLNPLEQTRILAKGSDFLDEEMKEFFIGQKEPLTPEQFETPEVKEFTEKTFGKMKDFLIPRLFPPVLKKLPVFKELGEAEEKVQKQIGASLTNMLTDPVYLSMIAAGTIQRGATKIEAKITRQQGKILDQIKAELKDIHTKAGYNPQTIDEAINIKVAQEFNKARFIEREPKFLQQTLDNLRKNKNVIVRDMKAKLLSENILPEKAGVKPVAKPAKVPVKEVKAIVKPVSKELQPIIKEARKYKSAEEFVKEVKTEGLINESILYHGSGETIKNLSKVKSISLGTYPAFAKTYGDIVTPVRIKSNAKILDLDLRDQKIVENHIIRGFKGKKIDLLKQLYPKSSEFLEKHGDSYGLLNALPDQYKAIEKYARDGGYDAVKIRSSDATGSFVDDEVIAINPKAFEIMNNRKLTDIWKQAQAKPPEVKPEIKPTPKPKPHKPTDLLKPKKEIKPKSEILKKQSRVAIIAKEKGLTDAKTGKFKPQYRRLIQGMFGKKIRTRDMTVEQLKIIEDAIKALPKPTMRAGRLIPPSIPRTSKLVTDEFFRRRFKQPTPISLFTSQNYYTEILGVAELTKPLELAKQRMDLEYRAMSRSVDEMGKIINKVGKTTLAEKVRAKLKNRPTQAISEMRDLLDKYEDAPDGLSPDKTKIFNWFRNNTRTALKAQNEIRRKLDIPEIPNRKAYVKHVASGMAQEMLQGKYPFPEGLKFWSEKIVGKKIFNPAEFQRELEEDIENLFSKDLIFTTKSMWWTGLKEIHLSQPLRSFNEQLGALSKDLPVYEDLPQDQLIRLRNMSVMPSSTKNWLVKYVNTVIKGQETQLDASVNRIITQSGLGGVLNKLMKPFGRVLSQKPITSTFAKLGRLTIHGVMGWRPKQLIRNKFQLTQNLALYTFKANLKGFFPASIDKNLERLMGESVFLKSYTGIEELPTNIQKKLEQLWMAPYQWTATSNAAQSMKVAYHDTLELITKSKYKQYGWADPQRTYKEPKGKLYKSEEEKLLKEMEFGAGVSQFSYIPIGMPQIFRYKALTPVTRLQSWWMNYFTKFTREATIRMFKGETSYGAKLPPSRRMGYMRYLIFGGAILSSLGYKRAFLLGVFPTYLSPAAQLALGMYTYVTAGSDWERNKAKRRMHQSWTAFIPGSLAWKDWSAVFTGKKDFSELFTYTKKGKK